MEKNNFVDYIRVFCRSGKGGAGSRHLLRTRFNAKGGPDGGDGGRGGHIILRGNDHLWTLLHLRWHKNILAENGGSGSGNHKHGRNGKDIILEVPLGTVVRDEETGKKEAEILEDGQEVILLPGGKGGLGNAHFKSATRQTPEYAQPGLPGKEGWKILELKVLADVGLVGFPNAGKSTLLSVMSAAKPEIANYPFTTLIPHLGIVSYRDDRSFCVADIPGIIKGAAAGKGLGHRFLRHIERNPVLLFMIPADSGDHKNELEVLLHELEAFNPELLDKKIVVAVTKNDLLDEELREEIMEELPKDYPVVFISSIQQQGINRLKDLLWKALTD